MGDLKVKDIINYIETSGVIIFEWRDTGESFCPTIGDFKRYCDFYIIRLCARNNELVITIQAEI